MTKLKLQDMNLTGQLRQDTLFGSSVRQLLLETNRISADSGYSNYFLPHSFDQLSVSENPLSIFSIDLSPIPTANISSTNVSYCYEGAAFASTDIISLSLRAVRPQPTCNRAKERAVPLFSFSACDATVTTGSRDYGAALNCTFCQQPGSRVVFSDTRLICPAWSTFPSRGLARLDVDAAFLGFWGCACPTDFFWGCVRAADLAKEFALRRSDMSLGELESLLQARTCLPCPPGLGMDCSPLAVVDAPHVVTRSVYPFLAFRSAGNG